MENVFNLERKTTRTGQREKEIRSSKLLLQVIYKKRRKRKFAPEPQEMNSESEIEMNSESEIESHPSSDSETSEFDME